ncbi:DNA glycosylase/AP lyase ROS1-like [Gastrolobium bilobum]|uniref:DNA glycosylase/AP lyase ROS1-like n=1 Tax=Gastrolobium bilobum TaxID=150636 RepID=UPI002AAF71B6|nr:DNA glycosylase/AP lyase ROS1-like [Gastrolobium bilobum]
MNFGERLLGQDEKQFQMSNAWVPITPEKLILRRSMPISDWPVDQNRRANYQEFPVPGSDYMEEMLLHHNGPDQNLHLVGQIDQIGLHNNFDGNSTNRKRVLNQIAGSYAQARCYESSGINSNTLELLLKKNATNIASANRNFDSSINRAARNPLLPNFYPQASTDVRESYAGVQRSNIHSPSDIVYKDANRLLIPDRNSEFIGSNSDSLLNNDIHCSVSNQPKSIFSEIPHGNFCNSNPERNLCGYSAFLMSFYNKKTFDVHSTGDSYPKYNINYVPITEADATASFTNSLQSIPKTMDQLKFVDSQFCNIPDYTIAESTSQEKDKQEDLVSSKENEIQEFCDGLLQQIVDSSSAAISTKYGYQKGSDSNICDKGSDLGFDLNKTPEQKAPKRRKHRPKVIVEAKPKRKSNPATQKTKNKDNPHKKKNVGHTAATTHVDVTKETFDSTVANRKSCRKALNFGSEKSGYESQSRIVCQQEIHHKNEEANNIISDYKATEMLGGAAIKYSSNSALLISQQDEYTVENQQPGNTDDVTLLLNQKLTNTFSSEKNPSIALSATKEEQQIAKSPVTDKRQGNSDLFQREKNGCMPQYIHAKENGNILFPSATCFGNSQKTQELIFQDTLQLVPNIISNSIEGKGSKRKYSNSTENQHDSATIPLDTSLCQEILQADENSNSAALAKGFVENQKRKKTQNTLHAKVYGRSSNKIMGKDDSQKVRIKDKNGYQSHYNREMPNFCMEKNRFVEQENNGVSTGDCFTISGEPHQIYSTLIDDIIYGLNGLNLKETNISEMEGQKALVPYAGDGSIVPYQEFEFAKKHKLRPRVDLDPETERTWKLLMGKEGSEGLEGTDKEKEKWWEEERNVFRGRADSFIARMHLVQGDRRFSKWKGSVVDSVIGVFLTQNVSDHLSSSAFMSLSARFPKSKSSKRSFDVVVTKALVEEPELSIVNPADTIISYGRGTLNQPTYLLGFVTPHHTGELRRDSEMIEGSLIKPNNQIIEEELLSSQDSLISSITQGTRIGSSSGSNSESEGLNSGCDTSKTQFSSSRNHLQVGKTTMFQEFYNSVNGVSLFEERTKDGKQQQAEHVNQSSAVGRNNSHNFHSAFNHSSNFEYPEKQVPFFPSTDYELHYLESQGLKTFQMNCDEFSWPETVAVCSKSQNTNYGRFGIREVGDSSDKPIEMQYGNGTLGYPQLPTMYPKGPLSNHSVLLQDTSQSRSHTNYNQPSPNHHLVGQKTLQLEGRPYTESLNTSYILGRGQDDVVKNCCNTPKHGEEAFNSENIISAPNRQVCSDNSRAEPKPQKQVYSPGPTDKESKFKVSKARKAKPKTEKKHADDWDKLRKEVEANGTMKERSEDTMDSLDYEALRCASVKEISDTIKERGMNNMLAERIKDFLNRLVKEHGNIDLEWLRYVPPDKAKEYLLSIRGLGLKSVECVRLLTLHHLAFPVDTNVGRIAVRLGWVPLQPLPEALQIHLLEQYPVLESIQKYLWPRLCKLDQRTLYELHYQMITFGKVFCTKKQPNCNACPMRAECRHFASAFASARLALPGPEEKRIVSMHVPIAAEENPSVNINPMILPFLENKLIKEASPESGQCEPIIEEPATPEQQLTEAIESDIEDFFGEDPDEIPLIEFSVEELAMNVQNYVQVYKEHHEGDMSKALVTLTPQSASIPTPKLKNMSRLRTEHHVYELPDSHPLLEKMDKREPDDPSPYLLAIWTPGETANSIEPPERRCRSRDSTNLCNDKTCFSCNSIREANLQTVRGTLLIPCRTATRGSFPLNGTYFQVNELFADHASSIQPIDIPRAWIWNLPRRTVYFGTSVSSIFKGLSTQEIQHCFWRGFVCVRGFDQQTHAPRPLLARLHCPRSKLAKTKK